MLSHTLGRSRPLLFAVVVAFMLGSSLVFISVVETDTMMWKVPSLEDIQSLVRLHNTTAKHSETHAYLDPANVTFDSPIPDAKAPDGDVETEKRSFPQPLTDLKRFKDFPPRNLDTSDGNAFATLLCSRDSSIVDPYFAATQSLVWRILWSWHASRKYPIIVFVCPFVPQEQRDVLAGQGAIIHEIELLDGVIDDKLITIRRWVDTFTKLNMWKFTQYKKIAFMDSDAFPIDNLDEIFDIAETRTCNRSLLMPDDFSNYTTAELDDMCNFTFAGVPWLDLWGGMYEINGGFLVFSPNIQMHRRLLRDCAKTDQYPLEHMEQGFFNSSLSYGPHGAFPMQQLSTKYNTGMVDYWDQAHLLEAKILHVKLWVKMGIWHNPFLNHRWDEDWIAQCEFYDTEKFARARTSGIFSQWDIDSLRQLFSREKQFMVDITLLRMDRMKQWDAEDAIKEQEKAAEEKEQQRQEAEAREKQKKVEEEAAAAAANTMVTTEVPMANPDSSLIDFLPDQELNDTGDGRPIISSR